MEGILRILLLATILCGGDSSASGSIENQSFKNRYGGGNRPRPPATNINYNSRPNLSYNRPLGYPEGVRFPYAGYTNQLPRGKPPVPPIKSSYISKPYPDFVIRFKPTLYPAEVPLAPAGPPAYPIPPVTYPPQLPPSSSYGGGGYNSPQSYGGGGGYNSPPPQQSYGGGGYEAPQSPPQFYGGYQQRPPSLPQSYKRFEQPAPNSPIYQPPPPPSPPKPFYEGPPTSYGANDKFKLDEEFQRVAPGPAPDVPINTFPGKMPPYFTGQENDRVAAPPPGAILLVADEDDIPSRVPHQEPPPRNNFNEVQKDVFPPQQSMAYNPPGQEGILTPIQSSSPHDPVHHSPDKSDDFKPMYLFGPVYFPKDGTGASGERVDQGSSWAGSDSSRIDNNNDGETSSIDKQDPGSSFEGSERDTAVVRQDVDQPAMSAEEGVVKDHPPVTQSPLKIAKTTVTITIPSPTTSKEILSKQTSDSHKKATTASIKSTTTVTTTTPRPTTLSIQKPMERVEKFDGNSSVVETNVEATTPPAKTTTAPLSDSNGHDVPAEDLVAPEVKQDTPAAKAPIKAKVPEGNAVGPVTTDTSRPDLIPAEKPSEHEDEIQEDTAEEDEDAEGESENILIPGPHPPIYVTKVIQGPAPNGYPMRPHFLPPYYQASFLPFSGEDEGDHDKKNDANEVHVDVDEDNPPRTADGKPIFFNLPKRKPSRRNEDRKDIIHEQDSNSDFDDTENEDEPIRIAVQAAPPFIPMMGHMDGEMPQAFRGQFAFQDRHPPPMFQGVQHFQDEPRPFTTLNRNAQIPNLPQSDARIPPIGSAVGQMPHQPFRNTAEENSFPGNQLRKSFAATVTEPQHQVPSASLNPNSLFPGFPLPDAEERIKANKWSDGSRQQIDPPREVTRHGITSTVSSMENPSRFVAKPEMSTTATDKSHESRLIDSHRSTQYRQQGFRMQQKAGTSTSAFPSTTTEAPTNKPRIRTLPSTTTHKSTSSSKLNTVKHSAVSVIAPTSNFRQPVANNTQRRRPGFKPYVARTYVTPTTYHPILSTVTTTSKPTSRTTMTPKLQATTQGSSIVSALDNSLEFSESVHVDHVEPYGIESAADHESLVRVHEGETYPEVVPYGTRLAKIN